MIKNKVQQRFAMIVLSKFVIYFSDVCCEKNF